MIGSFLSRGKAIKCYSPNIYKAICVKQNAIVNQQFSTAIHTHMYSETEGFYRRSPFDNVPTPSERLEQYVWKNLHKWEKRTAVSCIATGREYTYAELRDRSAALAVRLQIFKLRPKDVIAVCLPNIPEYPIAVLGSLEGGLRVTTINPIYTSHEIARQLTNSESQFVICSGEVYTTVQAACQLAKKDIPIVCVRTESSAESLPLGAIDFFDLVNPRNVDFINLDKIHDLDNTEIAFIPYSSGTTGMPKGVLLSHANITTNCEQIQGKVPDKPFVLETTETYQEIVPCILPFFHIYGLTVNMVSKLRLGSKLLTIQKFTPGDLTKALLEYKATVMHLVPPIILFLINSPNISAEQVKDFRMIMTGAAPIGASDAERFLAKFPHVEFIQGYGLTETSPCILLTPNGNKKLASAGFPTGTTDIKIVSTEKEDGIGLGPNDCGELWVRGPQVMQGYLNNPKANKETFFSGWMRTGDVAYYDDEGYFYITDRLKELIKVKGFQVPPAELEEILRNHPKILDAAVIGIPHQTHGEVPMAVVVLRKNANATENDIKEFVANQVAHYKRLEGGVHFVDEIPKSGTGKILRRELKAKYC